MKKQLNLEFYMNQKAQAHVHAWHAHTATPVVGTAQVITDEQRKAKALARLAAVRYELAGDEKALRAIYAGKYPEWQYGRYYENRI